MFGATEAIIHLMNDYAETFDGGAIERFTRLFSVARLHFEGMADLRGENEVKAFVAERVLLYDGSPRTNHILSNIDIRRDSDGRTAAASSYVTVMQAMHDFPLQVIGTARYRDRFRLDDDGWRFEERIVTACGAIPAAICDAGAHPRPEPEGPQQKIPLVG